MSVVKYALGLIVLIWLTFIILMPKQELYYKLEEVLVQQDIILNEEKIEEGLFGLQLKNINVYVKGINVAHIEEVDFFTLLFYSKLKITMLNLDESLKNISPLETEKAVMSHSVLAPFSVSVEALGSFGSMVGIIDLKESNVHLDFNESKNIQMLKPRVQKIEEGWAYETSF